MKTFKMSGLTKLLVLLTFVALSSVACSSGSTTETQPNVVIQTTVPQEELIGLDLKKVGALALKLGSGEALEKELNKPGGLNNLKLDDDPYVEKIQVLEAPGDANNKTLSLIAHMSSDNSKEQFLGNISVQRNPEKQNEYYYSVNGSPDVFGANHTFSQTLTGNSHNSGGGSHHHDSFDFGDALLLSWMMNSNRPAYIGNSYMSAPPVQVVERTVYRDRVRNVPVSNQFQPNAGAAPRPNYARQLSSPYENKRNTAVLENINRQKGSQLKTFKSASTTGVANSDGFKGANERSVGTTPKPAAKPAAKTSFWERISGGSNASGSTGGGGNTGGNGSGSGTSATKKQTVATPAKQTPVRSAPARRR